MDSLFVLKKFKNPKLVALDIFMQKADLFNDQYHISSTGDSESFLFLTFRNGFKFLHFSGRLNLFVAQNSAELSKIKDQIAFINSYKLSSASVIVLLEYNKEVQSHKDVLIYDLTVLTNELTNYVPFYYNELKSSLNIKSPALHSSINAIIAENRPINVQEKSAKDYSKELCQQYAEEFKKSLKKSPSDCAFIIGNGVSIPLGADPWDKLINNLVDYLTPFYIENVNGIVNELSQSNYLVSSFVKSTFLAKDQEDIYREGLKYCVYRKFNKGMLKENTLIKAIALAKIKYPSLPILTYNYDNFLEQQIIELNPSLKFKSYSGDFFTNHFEKSIIHLHGTIKQVDKTIDDKLVLTDDEYFKVYLNNKDNWAYRAQYECLLNKRCLFIGSSMSDVFQLSIIERVKQEKGNDWSCYALMCSKDLDSNEISNLLRFYYDRGIRIIFADDFRKIIDKLNEITGCYFDPVGKSYGK